MHQHDANCGPHAAVGFEEPGRVPPQHAHAAPYQPPAYEPPPYVPPPYVPLPDSKLYRALVAMGTKPSWLAPLAVLFCVGAAFSYVLTNNPADARPDPLGPCLFKAVTGLDCPGCGGTRMVWFLLHGDLGQAARHHAVALIAVPVVVYAYLAWTGKRLFGVSLPVPKLPSAAWFGYLGIWLVFSVVRNLPWEPFLYFRV